MSGELLGAIEREARAQGVWMVRGDVFLLAGWTMATGEAIEDYTIAGPRLPLGRVGIVRAGESWPGPQDRFEVSTITAALWLLARASGLTVRVGACPKCEARCGGWEWAQRWYGDCSTSPLPARWRDWPEQESYWEDNGKMHMAARPCPACMVDGKPTGIERRPLHEVLLAADHETRDRLAVFADGLLEASNPIGGLISLWLAGKLREDHVLGWGPLELDSAAPASSSLQSVERRGAHWLNAAGPGEDRCFDAEHFPSRTGPGVWLESFSWSRPALEARQA